jgi:uncharacterized protein (TIGR02246 family)
MVTSAAKIRVSMLATMVVLSACASGPKQGAIAVAPPSELSAVLSAYAQAWVSRDLAAFEPFFAKEAIVVVPGERYTGWEAIAERWLKPMVKDVTEFKVVPVEFMKLGDDIVETGNLQYRLTFESGKVETHGAKFTQRWQRAADGTWRIAALDLK